MIWAFFSASRKTGLWPYGLNLFFKKFQSLKRLTIPNAGARAPETDGQGRYWFVYQHEGGGAGRRRPRPRRYGPVRHPPQGPRPQVGAGLWVALAHTATETQAGGTPLPARVKAGQNTGSNTDVVKYNTTQKNMYFFM